jgi:hypothetical protein
MRTAGVHNHRDDGGTPVPLRDPIGNGAGEGVHHIARHGLAPRHRICSTLGPLRGCTPKDDARIERASNEVPLITPRESDSNRRRLESAVRSGHIKIQRHVSWRIAPSEPHLTRSIKSMSSDLYAARVARERHPLYLLAVYPVWPWDGEGHLGQLRSIHNCNDRRGAERQAPHSGEGSINLLRHTAHVYSAPNVSARHPGTCRRDSSRC